MNFVPLCPFLDLSSWFPERAVTWRTSEHLMLLIRLPVLLASKQLLTTGENSCMDVANIFLAMRDWFKRSSGLNSCAKLYLLSEVSVSPGHLSLWFTLHYVHYIIWYVEILYSYSTETFYQTFCFVHLFYENSFCLLNLGRPQWNCPLSMPFRWRLRHKQRWS